MNQTEAQTIISALNRAGLVQAMEGQAAVWADALDDVRYEDGVDAAKVMIKTRLSTERWITPGDIREQVRVVRLNRASRYAGWRAHLTPPDIDDDRYRVWLRSVERYLGDGLDPIAADRAARSEMGIPLEIEGSAA